MATPIDVVVFKCRKNFSKGNRWNRALFAWPKTKQNFGCLSNCRYRSRPESARASPHCSRFHPNRFTFGGVIAERVKTVLLPHRVFAWYALRAYNYLRTVSGLRRCAFFMSERKCLTKQFSIIFLLYKLKAETSSELCLILRTVHFTRFYSDI